MKKHVFFIIILLLVGSDLKAIDPIRIPDTRSVGMGGNEVTQSYYYNPCLLTLYEKRNVSFHYYNPYGIKELGTATISGIYPDRRLSTGVQLATFGYEEYKQWMFRGIFSKQLHETWFVGLSFQYIQVRTILNETHSGKLSTDFGISYSPVDNVLIGMLITDFPSINLNSQNVDKKIFTTHLGFEWFFINTLLIAGSIVYNKTESLQGNLGIEFIPYDTFSICVGMKTSPFLPSFGFGYKWKNMQVDTSFVYHPVLRMSLGIGLTYLF